MEDLVLTFEWQNILHEAMVESDPAKLQEKVITAEEAIFCRLQALGPSDSEERQALHDASDILLDLKREVLRFPDWHPGQA
jgi:hypothetical protein